PPPAAVLEHPPQSRLELARITQPGADRAVEVEQQSTVRGVLEVVGVRDVEDFDDQLRLPLAPRVDGSRQPHVPGEVRVVLAERVARENADNGSARVSADPILRTPGTLTACLSVYALLRHGLRRVIAYTVVPVNLAGKLREQPAVEPMPLVAVTPVVFGPEVVRPGVTEGEGITFVIVVRLVEREGVVELELE